MSTDTDTLTYATVDAEPGYYATLEWRDGGAIALGDGVAVPGDWYATDYGVALGPLHVATQGDGDLVLDRVQFPREAESLLDRYLPDLPDVDAPDVFDEENETTNNTTAAAVGAAGMAAAADADETVDDPMLTRRDLMATAAAGVGALAVSGEALAAEDAEPIAIADLSVKHADGPVELRLSDAVANVLPTTTTYDVVVDGTKEGTITGGQSAAIPADWLDDGPTTVTIQRDADVWADLKALLATPTLTYAVDLPDPSVAAAGSELVLATDRLIAEPLAQAGGDNTVLMLDDTSVPHRSEDDSSAVGWYATRTREDGRRELIYRVGEEAPSATTAALEIEVGALGEISDDLDRTVSEVF